MENKNELKEQENLQLINEMIAQVRNNIQSGAANSMIMAGYFVAAIAALNYVLLQTLDKPYQSYWVWLLMIPMFAADKILYRKRSKKTLVKTHIDRIITGTWHAFCISAVVLLITVFAAGAIIKSWVPTLLITPVILLLMGLAQFVTAVASKYRPYYYASVLFWLGALAAACLLLITGNGNLQFIVLALCAVLGFVVPGYIMNSKAEKNV